MAFNIQTFKTRALTAIVFAAIMLGGIFFNPYAFMALFTIIAVGCMIEFAKLIKLYYQGKKSIFLMFWAWFASFYIFFPIFSIVKLSVKGEGNAIQLNSLFPAAIFFSIWINDTMAYIVGSFIGKTPFSKISPKKTWEGTIGGAILCVVVITLIFSKTSLFPNSLTVYNWIIISSLCAVFGTLGDLFESKLKRMAGVKDSGNIMPGHGGFLDRFDSFLFAAPAVWVYVKYFIS
jgi:phosphatidate cytidylyltransferase